MERSYEKYFRQNRLPHLWCPGCGNGIAMKAIVEAIDKKGLSQTMLRQPLLLCHYLRFAQILTCIQEYPAPIAPL